MITSRSSGSTTYGRNPGLGEILFQWIFVLIFDFIVEVILYICRNILLLIKPKAIYYVVSLENENEAIALLYIRAYQLFDEEAFGNELKQLLNIPVMVSKEVQKVSAA